MQPLLWPNIAPRFTRLHALIIGEALVSDMMELMLLALSRYLLRFTTPSH
jgi:hypothetical protein